MAIPITIPRLGWNMEEGKFGGWLKADGDRVVVGDRLFALESDKATEEIETLDGGFLRIPSTGPAAGDQLIVGAVIGYLVASMDEPLPAVGAAIVGIAETRAVVEPASPIGTPIPERDDSPTSSPRARRAAHESGVDWTTLTGSGKKGRIRERDVRAATVSSDLPLTPIRRTIAERMVASQHATAPVTLTSTADATKLVATRSTFKSTPGPVPSFTDFFVKLVADALGLHPLLGAQWTANGIRLPKAIDIGIAVDTEAGLLVPVVRNVPALRISQLAAITSALFERARTGQLAAADMQGGCFTITNLGGFGIDAFTPIINHPQCAILGMGRIARRPTVIGDAIVARDQVTLSLTFDHRIVDGAPAARFLQSIVQLIENVEMTP